MAGDSSDMLEVLFSLFKTIWVVDIKRLLSWLANDKPHVYANFSTYMGSRFPNMSFLFPLIWAILWNALGSI